MEKRRIGDWALRFVKGLFIGSGFILPGVSGGALAAVFGIYERMIAFAANLTRDFKENFRFFLPVGLGGASGVFLLSFAVSFLLGAYEAQILWCFIGCILGTLPALWRQAGKRGRRPLHGSILAVSAVAGYLLMRLGEGAAGGPVAAGSSGWLLAGGIIGLGAIVPGLSPSNFLVYFGLYKPMADGIKSLDWGVILPLGIGMVLCVLLLAKLMDAVFAIAYAGVYHCILGVVLASTVMIIPTGAVYNRTTVFGYLAACIAGALMGYWMSALEDRYKPQQ